MGQLPATPPKCPTCGTQITYKRDTAWKRFCSSKCRSVYWNNERREQMELLKTSKRAKEPNE